MRTSIALAILCSLLAAGKANADSFTILPNGRVVFNVSLTTRGVFTCLASIPCTGSGTNSVTVGSGASTTTITFTGVSSSFQVGDSFKPVNLGSIQASATDSGFTFPTRRNPNLAILRFRLFMTQNAGPHEEPWSFGPGGASTIRFLRAPDQHAAFGIRSNPPGFHYSAIVYSFNPFPFSMPSNGVRDIGAKVGTIPEPATLLLLGAGLAGAAYRQRRKAARGSSKA